MDTSTIFGSDLLSDLSDPSDMEVDVGLIKSAPAPLQSRFTSGVWALHLL